MNLVYLLFPVENNTSFPYSPAVKFTKGKTPVIFSGVLPNLKDEKPESNDTLEQITQIFKKYDYILKMGNMSFNDILFALILLSHPEDYKKASDQYWTEMKKRGVENNPARLCFSPGGIPIKSNVEILFIGECD